MKVIGRVLLALALLAQGALAAAMPLPNLAAHASGDAAMAGMPCHGDAVAGDLTTPAGKSGHALPCCTPHDCACAALCAGAALPQAVDRLPHQVPVTAVSAASIGALQPAHRYTPLKPPIVLSA